ncbi:MAG: hypothetical protein HDR45_05480 [Bacteroides sp.]|nr:hypothetical protein [Bacteroides sp.]
MINCIDTIGDIIFGSGATGLFQYFCKRNDSKKEKKRESLGAILSQLSLFGSTLHTAYNDWCDNINKLEPILDEHIKYIEKHNEEVKSVHQEGDKIIEKYQACACELATTCPHRIVGEEPDEFDKWLENYKNIEANYIGHRKEFISKCVEIIDSITPSLSDYADFLSHIPEAYMLPTKLFKKIYPFLSAVEKSNEIISLRIRLIKSEPEYIGDKDRNLRQPILNAINLVEAAKLRINEILTEI